MNPNDYALPRHRTSHPPVVPSGAVGRTFQYRGAAKDGGTLEYVFEAGEQNSPDAVAKEEAAEIAADFMTTFHHVQVGALETQVFRTMPVPFWLICFSDTIKGALRQFYFVVLLSDGTVVERMCSNFVVEPKVGVDDRQFSSPPRTDRE
jgi:hypothetical protein